MKILCVIEHGTWIDAHIVSTLRSVGHKVEVFYYGAGVGEFYGDSKSALRVEKNRALLNQAQACAKDGGLDLIFCYVYDDFLLPETALALSRMDVPMVNYNVDMISQWYRQTRTARYFTRMLCAQTDNIKELARYNPRVLYFPMAGRKLTSDEPGQDYAPAAPVTFLGTPTPYRTKTLYALHQAGIPLALYGKYWQEGLQASADLGFEKTISDLCHYTLPKFRSEGMRGLLRSVTSRFTHQSQELACSLPPSLFHGFLPDNALDSFFRNSTVNLGFTRMLNDDPAKKGATQLKLRDFEVPLAGGFYLVEKVPEYGRHFVSGSEVETWENSGELADKIRYYLKNPAACREIAAAGKARAEKDHTWENRFAMLFDNLGIGR